MNFDPSSQKWTNVQAYSKKYEAVSEIKFAQQLFGHHQPKKEQPKPQ